MQELKLLAKTQDTTEGIPVEPEPVEAQRPPPAIPVEIRNAAEAIGALPDRSRESEVIVPPLFRDLVLMLLQPLCIFMAEVGLELDSSPTDHLLASDSILVLLQNRDHLQIGNGGDAQRDVLQQCPAFLTHVAGEDEDDLGCDRNRLKAADSPKLIAIDLLMEVRIAEIGEEAGSQHHLHLLDRRVLKNLKDFLHLFAGQGCLHGKSFQCGVAYRPATGRIKAGQNSIC